MTLASDYPITFKFGATTAPYSASRPHTGEDRAMPVGTHINVGDTVVGLSGGLKGAPGSGTSTGPHLHVQKYKDEIFLHPHGTGLGNSIPFPARVIETGTKSDLGNYVRVLDANGFRWSYFHLSQIKVKVGHIINADKKDTPMLDKNFLTAYHIDLLHRGPTEAEKKEYLGQPALEVYNKIRNSEERKKLVAFQEQIAKDNDTRAQGVIDLQNKVAEMERSMQQGSTAKVAEQLEQIKKILNS